nr:lipoate--protein ligase [Candidatus Njordarchaeota archaeon]
MRRKRRKMTPDEKWRLLKSGLKPVYSGLATDEAILKVRTKGLVSNTLRLYGYDPPAVIVGHHQFVDDNVNEVFRIKSGLDLSRRITGGGTILIDKDQIAVAAIARRSHIGSSLTIGELFERFSSAIVIGLRNLGVGASFRPKNDVVDVGGRKMAGTGVYEEDNTILYHSCVLMDFDASKMINVLKTPYEKLSDKVVYTGWCFQPIKSAEERITTIKKELGRKPSRDEVEKAIASGFEEALGITLEKGELTEEENKLTQELEGKYRSQSWIQMVKNPAESDAVVSRKTKGGLVNVHVSVFTEGSGIKSVTVVGDFFAYPPRGISDLESALKWTPINDVELRKIVFKLFDENLINIFRVTKEEFFSILMEAVSSAYSKRISVS